MATGMSRAGRKRSAASIRKLTTKGAKFHNSPPASLDRETQRVLTWRFAKLGRLQPRAPEFRARYDREEDSLISCSFRLQVTSCPIKSDLFDPPLVRNLRGESFSLSYKDRERSAMVRILRCPLIAESYPQTGLAPAAGCDILPQY